MELVVDAAVFAVIDRVWKFEIGVSCVVTVMKLGRESRSHSLQLLLHEISSATLTLAFEEVEVGQMTSGSRL